MTGIQLIQLRLPETIVNCTICVTLTPNSTPTTEHETEVWHTAKHHSQDMTHNSNVVALLIECALIASV